MLPGTCGFPATDDSGRVAGDDAIGFYVPGNDGAGADNRTTSDCHSRQNDDLASDPHIVLDDDHFVILKALFAHRHRQIIEAVVLAQDQAMGPHHDVVSNADHSDLATLADSGVVADLTLSDVEKFNVRSDVDVFPETPEQGPAYHRSYLL
jgi:hypothetical protein